MQTANAYQLDISIRGKPETHREQHTKALRGESTELFILIKQKERLKTI